MKTCIEKGFAVSVALVVWIKGGVERNLATGKGMKAQHLTRGVLLVGVLACLLAQQSSASILFSTNYGDRVASTVTYQQVTESSITDANALYGVPTTSGNTLNLAPVGFGSYVPDTIAGSDKTDGQLDFTVVANTGVLTDLNFSERGDYSMFGFTSSNAFVDVSAWYHVKILEVDGHPVSGAPIEGSVEMDFLPSPDGSYWQTSIPLQDGIWTGNMTIDLLALLDDAGEGYDFGATKVAVSLDNHLTAYSALGSEAFIAKKDFTGFSITAVPEPATMSFIAFFTCGLWFTRRFFPAV